MAEYEYKFYNSQKSCNEALYIGQILNLYIIWISQTNLNLGVACVS